MGEKDITEEKEKEFFEEEEEEDDDDDDWENWEDDTGPSIEVNIEQSLERLGLRDETTADADRREREQREQEQKLREKGKLLSEKKKEEKRIAEEKEKKKLAKKAKKEQQKRGGTYMTPAEKAKRERFLAGLEKLQAEESRSTRK